MFGRKADRGRDGEIDVSSFGFLDGSLEFARLWSEPQGPLTCIIEPRALGADPALFGMAMVDAVRHAANAYANAAGMPVAAALERIWQGFDAERENPTDEPVVILPGGNLN